MKLIMIDAMLKHAEGQIAKHRANVLESIEKELNAMGKYEEQIEILNKYFVDK